MKRRLNKRKKDWKERQAKCNRPFEEKESYRVEAFLELEKKCIKLKKFPASQRTNESTTHTEIRPELFISSTEREIFRSLWSSWENGQYRSRSVPLIIEACRRKCSSVGIRELPTCTGGARSWTAWNQETKRKSDSSSPILSRQITFSFSAQASRLLNVYAVFLWDGAARRREPVSWMLLTTESVITMADAQLILRWYTYRWRVEEYHKILKSGCQ